MMVGLWTVVLGYALLYTGTAYFIQGESAPGLAQVFGISSLQSAAQSTTSTSTPQASATTGSVLV